MFRVSFCGRHGLGGDEKLTSVSPCLPRRRHTQPRQLVEREARRLVRPLRLAVLQGRGRNDARHVVGCHSTQETVA